LQSRTLTTVDDSEIRGSMPHNRDPSGATSGSAYGEFMEGKKGELKAGEFADFIALSNDLSKVSSREYTNTRVLRTVVGGRTVYLATAN
jgi:predicted amidohydrolase YtcJ